MLFSKLSISTLFFTALFSVVKPQNITDDTNTSTIDSDGQFSTSNVAEINYDDVKNQLLELDSRIKSVEEHIHDTKQTISSTPPNISNQPWLEALARASANNPGTSSSSSTVFSSQPSPYALFKEAKNQQKPQNIIEYPVFIIPDTSFCQNGQLYTRPYPVYPPQFENQNYVQPPDYARVP
ncbi:hypothetical protein DICVIV_00286 [Dictyocaulus viviparus]|uniref:Uncharacterized protein n=1 Tax=Dictyocaulus viviparus TaxID=29172 RepID=A0A0D8YFV7_DICVI|nr:hypothetical protein DICVIV_00286 [Dictyocaulus viviparus]